MWLHFTNILTLQMIVIPSSNQCCAYVAIWARGHIFAIILGFCEPVYLATSKAWTYIRCNTSTTMYFVQIIFKYWQRGIPNLPYTVCHDNLVNLHTVLLEICFTKRVLNQSAIVQVVFINANFEANAIIETKWHFFIIIQSWDSW